MNEKIMGKVCLMEKHAEDVTMKNELSMFYSLR